MLTSQDHHPSTNSVHETICCSWWWEYVPETCRAKNTSIKLPSCIKFAFHFISWGRCRSNNPHCNERFGSAIHWEFLDYLKTTGLSEDNWSMERFRYVCVLWFKSAVLASDVKHGRRRNIVVGCCRILRNFIMSPHSLSALWSNRTKTSHQILEMPDRLPSRRSFLKCLLLSRWLLITRSVDENILPLYVIETLIPNNTVFYCI